MKLLILHDYFLYKGGGERLIISLAKGLGADVVTSFIAKDGFDPREHGIPTTELLHETWLSRLPGFRYLQVQWSFLFRTKKILEKYDTIIYSGDCLTALLNAQGKRNIAYMHTPPRHLYDNFQETLDRYSWPKKLIFWPFVWFNRWRFFTLSQRFDFIITNSKNVQERIKRYLGLESTVVYPPCDTLPFKNLGYGDYFFSWARLYPIKRVDMIVAAFQKMPDKKLVIASGGPEEKRLRAMAEGYDNIKVLGWISDADLLQYLGKCLATIYIPVREDFGMSPVESMTAGKPVVGVAEGGMLEILEDGKNSWLLQPDFTVENLAAMIRTITPERVRAMEPACVTSATRFSEAHFLDSMRQLLASSPRVYALEERAGLNVRELRTTTELGMLTGKFVYFSSGILVIAAFDTYHKDIADFIAHSTDFRLAGKPIGYGRIEHGSVTSWKSYFFGETPQIHKARILTLLKEFR